MARLSLPRCSPFGSRKDARVPELTQLGNPTFAAEPNGSSRPGIQKPGLGGILNRLYRTFHGSNCNLCGSPG